MKSRQLCVGLLIAANAVLLSALLMTLDWLPSAFAQAGGASRSGDYASVTGKVSAQSYDALYVLDVPQRKLHVFYPGNVQTREISYGGSRDLKADFAN